MTVVADSTVIFHFNRYNTKMLKIIKDQGVTELWITRISYIELLSGASENAKVNVRKILHAYPILEFDKKACNVANTLAMKYRIGAKNSKDFLIACIAIANKLPLVTENIKDFNYTELNLLPYKI